MALLVLGYPTLTPHDRQWIQRLRARHDEHYRLVEPHFTLVFPLFGVGPQPLLEHVRHQASGCAPIAFVLDHALAVKDVLSGATHTFLVPGEGYAEIVALHAALYRGLLASKRRADVPFIPHLTVGSALDPEVCRRLADELNAQGFRTQGVMEALDVVVHENRTVTTIERVRLGPAAPS